MGTRFGTISLGYLCLALAGLYQLICIFQPLVFLVDVIFERDDAFYYFKIAQETAWNGQPSFDGIHASNGVQFLWHYLLTGLAYLVSDKIDYLRAVLGLCLAFNLLAGVMIWHLGRRLMSPRVGEIALVLWAGIMVERWHTLQGMEFPLHIVVILATLIVLWRIWQTDQIRGGDMALLGVLLTLNYWTRLDAVLISIPIWAGMIWLIYTRRDPARAQMSGVILLTLPPAIGALLYIAASHQMAGTWLPLSGGVKLHYASLFFDTVSGQAALNAQIKWALKIQSMLVLALVPAPLLEFPNAANFDVQNITHLALALSVPVLVFGGALVLWRRGAKALAVAGVLLWMICLVHIAIEIASLADFSHVTRHYFGWLMIFWLIWGALLFDSFLELLPVRAGQLISAALLLGLIGIYAVMGTRSVRDYEPQLDNYALVRLALAQDLNGTLPAHARIGAWNAGVLGYFLERPVINLDGLVNDTEFLEVLQSGAPLQDYMRAKKITHLIDHNERDLTLKYLESRDTEAEFRNGIRWDEVEVLDQRYAIYVLRWRGLDPDQ